ncbi:MAG: septum formation family protein, partial [Haloechinothrix sp.]
WAGPGGTLQPTSGLVAAQDQSPVWPAGTCLALVGKTVGDPIDCAEPHSYEMIAVVDVSDEFGKEYPSEKEQHAWLDKTCSKLAEEYTGGLDLGKKKLILAWDTRQEESWDAGSYLVNCKVGAKLADGSGLAPVTGSIKEAPTTKRDGG